MNPEIIVAADLGNSKIAVMAAEKLANGKLRILDMESEPTPLDSIRNGVVMKPSEVAAHLSAMFKLLSNRIKLPIHKFYVGLNGRSLRSVRVSVPRIFGNEEEITEAVLAEIRSQVELTEVPNRTILRTFTDVFAIDNEPIKNPIGVFGGNLSIQYVLAVAKPELFDNVNKCVDRLTGYALADYFLAPLATSVAVVGDAEKELGCAVVDLGAGCTSVSVYKDGLIKHLAVVPFGGKHITNDLKSLRLLEDEAEKLKLMFGEKFSSRDKKVFKFDLPSNIPGGEVRSVLSKDLEMIIEARLGEIFDLVKDQICKSGFSEDLGAGVILTGGVSNARYISEFAQNRLGMNVRIGSHATFLDGESDPKYFRNEYAQLIGLLVCGTENCCSVTLTQKEATTHKSSSKKSKGLGAFMISIFADDAGFDASK